MSAAALKRPVGTRPSSARAKGAGRPAGREGSKAPSLIARAFATIPLSARAWERIVTATVILAVAAGLIVAAVIAGVPALVAREFSRSAASLGFVVKRVEVTGLARMDRLTVYSLALDQQSRSMADIDLEAIRASLLRYGWIADARVSRRLPDTLIVDIVERRPAAVWQHGGKLTLIDAAGVPLQKVSAQAMPELPLLIGPGANGQAPALDALIARTPRLKPLLAAATWIGNRRWDMKFQSGETLSLPEGEDAARRALLKFEGLDAQDRLLGRGLVRFDMRDPTRMFVRVRRGAEALPPVAPAPPAASDEKAGGVA